MLEIKVGDKIRLSPKINWGNIERRWSLKSFKGFIVKEIVKGTKGTFVIFDISSIAEGRYDITMLEKI